ncbi:MAG: YncE family protein [Candidatus Nanopelagicaceae bacterium]
MPLNKVGLIKDGSIVDADISPDTTISASKLDLSGAAIDPNNLTLTGSTQISNGVTISKPNFDTLTYTGKSFVTSASLPHSLFFSIDGYYIYILDTLGDTLYSYQLASPWNMSSLIQGSAQTSLSAQDSAPYGLYISPDGENLYMCGQFSGDVYQYKLPQPWVIANMYLVGNIDIGSANCYGIDFRPDGKEFWALDNPNSTIKKWTLSTPWDITTAQTTIFSIQVGSGTNDFRWTQDGRFLVTIGGTTVRIYPFSVPWTFTSAGSTITKTVTQDNSAFGIYVKPDCTKVYTIGQQNDDVYEYDVTGLGSTVNYGSTVINGSLTVNEQLDIKAPIVDPTFAGNAFSSGLLQIQKSSEAINPNSSYDQSLGISSGELTIDLSISNIHTGDPNASITTWNFTNVPTERNRVITVTLILIGQTGQDYGSGVKINGQSSTNVRWQGGTSPSGSNGGTDILTFTILRDNNNSIRTYGAASTNHI